MMELLAPAGSAPAFEAALQAGADAVYVGAPRFNARALAKDLSFAEIAAMIRFAHQRGKKVYLAMNSLVKEDELALALKTLVRLAEMQADGLIVQDLGLISLARKHAPGLPLHASTLMTAHNSLAPDYFAALGCRRLVLARELSLAQLASVSKKAERAGIELELFVHGAMCFSYSGLCRFSSLHGGHSSLRGQCVQPCRRRYRWLASGQHGQKRASARESGYFFSMNDLCALDFLDDFAQLGVAGLKIEGRLKPLAYVRNTVRAYRLALDARKEADAAMQTKMLQEAHACLTAAMGRKSGSGFFLANADAESGLISPEQSGSTGTLLAAATVRKPIFRQNNMVAMQLEARLNAPLRSGDRVRLHEEQSDTRLAFTAREFFVAGRPRKMAEPGEIVSLRLNMPELIPLGSRRSFCGRLYKVDESGRRERVGPELSALIQKAQAEPGAGPDCASLARAAKGPRKHGQEPAKKARWWLRATTLAALRLRFPFAISRLLLNLTPVNLEQCLAGTNREPRGMRQGVKLTWALPSVLLEEQLLWYREAIGRLIAAGFTSFQLGHAGQLGLFPENYAREDGELFVNENANALNSETLAALSALGFRGVQFSLETDRDNLQASLAAFAWQKKPCAAGLLVYGRPALFASHARAPHFKGRHALSSQRGERFVLNNTENGVELRAWEPFSLVQFGRELVWGGLDYLVVDVSHGPLQQEADIFSALWRGRGAPQYFSGNYAGVLA